MEFIKDEMYNVSDREVMAEVRVKLEEAKRLLEKSITKDNGLTWRHPKGRSSPTKKTESLKNNRFFRSPPKQPQKEESETTEG